METNQEIKITTSVGSSQFTIPRELPQTIFLDVYGRSYKIYSDGTIEEEK
jgi:hypothetical protein